MAREGGGAQGSRDCGGAEMDEESLEGQGRDPGRHPPGTQKGHMIRYWCVHPCYDTAGVDIYD